MLQSAFALSSWPGFVPAIHVFLVWVQPRRGCPGQARARRALRQSNV